MPKRGGTFYSSPLRPISWRWLKLVHAMVALAAVLLIGSVVMVILSHPATPDPSAMGLMVVTEGSAPRTTRVVIPNLQTGRAEVISQVTNGETQSGLRAGNTWKSGATPTTTLRPVAVGMNDGVLTLSDTADEVDHAIAGYAAISSVGLESPDGLVSAMVSGEMSGESNAAAVGAGMGEMRDAGQHASALGDSAQPMFNGRPLRKVKTITMKVTAYSPDAQSCGEWADGQTASGYSVWTNGMKLVAADTKLLPFGSIITVPGYHGGQPVPVLDRGGKIKGKRLDVLYPTHEVALVWGVQDLDVDVWEYADEPTQP